MKIVTPATCVAIIWGYYIIDKLSKKLAPELSASAVWAIIGFLVFGLLIPITVLLGLRQMRSFGERRAGFWTIFNALVLSFVIFISLASMITVSKVIISSAQSMIAKDFLRSQEGTVAALEAATVEERLKAAKAQFVSYGGKVAWKNADGQLQIYEPNEDELKKNKELTEANRKIGDLLSNGIKGSAGSQYLAAVYGGIFVLVILVGLARYAFGKPSTEEDD